MSIRYYVLYWALFFSILANIDLGITVAGLPLNLQRIVFAVTLCLIVLDFGARRAAIRIPNYSLLLLGLFAALLAIELFHDIRLQRIDPVVVNYVFTMLLIVALSLIRFEAGALDRHVVWLAILFVATIALTVFQSFDLAMIASSLSLDGDYYNSIRLRSADSRNIVNSWAAGVVIALAFYADLSSQNPAHRGRYALLFALTSFVALVTLLTASRAALALFLIYLALFGAREIRLRGKFGTVGALALWAGALAAAAVMVQDSAMFLRLSELVSGEDTSAVKRLSAFSSVGERIHIGFFLGHGEALSENVGVASENTFLSIIYRYGAIGLIIYSMFWFVLLRSALAASRPFATSTVVVFMSLLTNDLLFFPIALFVLIEVLHSGRASRPDHVGSDYPDGGTQPAQGIGGRPCATTVGRSDLDRSGPRD